jgi:NADP-dependent 3-hydroxy acid dehydrogenase YdfG
MSDEQTVVIFGARHLGGAIAAHFASRGWQVAAVALTQETVDALKARTPRAKGIRADLSDPGAAADVLRRVHAHHGSIKLIVNAISDPAVASSALAREGGERTELASPIGAAVTPVHHVIDASLEILRAQGAGTLIQITGGLALRARRGTGPLAATGYATRALVEGAIADARDDNVHLALLVIRGLIESDLTAATLAGRPAKASMTADDVIAAIELLVAQGRGRAWTHEVTLTPPGAPWQD